MIILNSKKVNTNFINILKNYINTYNFGSISCHSCHSTDYIRWGHYERNVIYFSENKISLLSCVLSIQRIKCKSCGKTHALLPIGIIPYKQFTEEVISKLLYEALSSDIEVLSSKYLIDSSTINRWIFQFNSIHFPWLSTLTLYHNKKDALFSFINNFSLKIQFIINYNLCFMQIKKPYLGLCPS